jgi:type II restriction enzyme
MQLECDLTLAARYTSQTQIARVLSESWYSRNGYCLSCENDQLSPTAANSKASDFTCADCSERYELKAFKTEPAKRLVNGAFDALISRIRNGSVPTLVLMKRDEGWKIQSLSAVHHLFLTPDVVERREPLSPSARRAGWTGCNIRLDLIGADGRIPIIESGVAVDRKKARERFRQFQPLRDVPPSLRGWATLTLKTIRGLGRPEFSLGDVYARESEFTARYPDNRNVRAKIRQQLQVLRDLGLLEFRGLGQYRLLI